MSIKMKQKCYYNSPIGVIGIEEENGYIVGLNLEEHSNRNSDVESETLKETKKQLEEYFNGKRYEFDLPLKLIGTEFQLKVWKALQEIPYGETCCYSDIAQKIGNPKAIRAVGNANNKNPVMIIVPCHRVIGKNGALVGFGAGIEVKKYLLEMEEKYRSIMIKIKEPF